MYGLKDKVAVITGSSTGIGLEVAKTLKKHNARVIITYFDKDINQEKQSLELIEKHPNISVDLIDLRTLQPLDHQSIIETVKRTGKVIVLTEDSLFGSIANDIAAYIMEECFEFLDAPVKRIGSLETPIPFATQLENQYLAKDQLEQELQKLRAF